MTDTQHDDAELVAQLRELEIDMVLDGDMRGVVRAAADRITQLEGERREISMALGNQPDEPVTTAELIQSIERISRIAGKGALEIARLREALRSISSVRYGLDASDSAEEAAKYWGDLCIEYRAIARAALNDKGGDTP